MGYFRLNGHNGKVGPRTQDPSPWILHLGPGPGTHRWDLAPLRETKDLVPFTCDPGDLGPGTLFVDTGTQYLHVKRGTHT